MSGAMGGGISGPDQFATTEYDRMPTPEYEPPVQPARPIQPIETAPAMQPIQTPPAVQFIETAPAVQRIQAAPIIQPVQTAPAVQHAQSAIIDDQNVPEIPVSKYVDTQGQGAQVYPKFVKNAAPSPSSASSHLGVKTWLKTAFRRTSKGQKEEKKLFGGPSPFVGGASLTQPNGTPPLTAGAAIGGDETPGEISVSRFLTATDGSRYPDHDELNVGMVSNPVGETVVRRGRDFEEESEEAKDQFNDADVAMPVFKSQRPLSPARDSRFREVI
jgi:hypothetical protein